MSKILFISSGSGIGGGEKNLLDIVKYASKEYKVSAVVPSEGLLAEKFREIGCSVYTCNLSLLNINSLKKIIKSEYPDLIHIQGLKASFVGRIAAKLLNIHCINAVHGLHYFYYENYIKGRLFLIVDRFLRRWTDGFICASKSVYDQVVNILKVEKDKVWLIYNGLDYNHITQVNADTIKKEKTIICVGSLHKPKGQIYLIKAIPLINQTIKNVKYLIVGDGDEETKLKSYVKENNLEPYITFTGFKKNVLELMRKSSILVMPSLWECLPYVLLEAMAVGLPIVATNVGGISEIVINNETGVLVPPKNEKELAKAIIKLLESPELCVKMGNDGRIRAIENFSKNKMCKQTLIVYRTILDLNKDSKN